MNHATNRITSTAARLSLGSSVYPFEDVTALIDDAAKDLKVGQLVQVESFSLFDAMCAIVIMDPKMDTGMVIDDYATRPQYDVNQQISPRNFIWIMDNILIGQMTWLSGHALSQTLFTSCYILRAMEIDDAVTESDSSEPGQPLKEFVPIVLKPCVLAIAKTCAFIWDEMRKGQVYEEEDFMTNKFGVSMYENFPLASLVAMLDHADYWMERTGKKWIEDSEESSSDLYNAIKDRIYYARASLLSIYQVLAPKCSQFRNALPQLRLVRERAKRMQASSAQGREIADAFDHAIHRKLVTNTPPRAIALLTMTETFDQLDSMFEDLVWIGEALDFSDPTSLMNFFIYFGAKKPAPGAFARSVLQTVSYDDNILMGSRTVQEIILQLIRETVHPVSWVFDIFETASNPLDKANKQQPVNPDGLPTVPEDDETDPALASKKQFWSMLVLFLDEACKPFVDTLHIMAQNVPRQRRNLRKVLQLWETLQRSAEMLDEALHMTLIQMSMQEADDNSTGQDEAAPQPFYFVSWAFHMKQWVMEWMLLLGSELELYSLFEFSMIYGIDQQFDSRYCDVILGSHARHLRRIQSVVDGDIELLRKQVQSQADAAKKKKKKKKKKKDATKPDTPSTSTSLPPILTAPTVEEQVQMTQIVRAQLRLVSIRLGLARGVFLVLAALTKVGYLTTTPSHLAAHGLNDLETLYKRRFKAFHHLSSPELLSYPAFLKRLDCERLDALDILDEASVYFVESKKVVDELQLLSATETQTNLCQEYWSTDLKNMANVCIESGLMIETFTKDARIQELRAFRTQYIAQQLREKLRLGKLGLRMDPSLARSLLPPSDSMPPPEVLFKSPKRNVVLDWKYHLWWPVIRLEDVKTKS
ncbi:hypothetical protein BGZ94_008794 [Podila epigama]|nr:hypothetical protein BGZ94_008794 [Podila epigama]